MKTILLLLFILSTLWGDGTPWGWWERDQPTVKRPTQTTKV
jgi:hypothetical protein